MKFLLLYIYYDVKIIIFSDTYTRTLYLILQKILDFKLFSYQSIIFDIIHKNCNI